MTTPNTPGLGRAVKKTSLDYHSLIQTAWAKFRNLAEAQRRNDLISDLTPVIERFDLGIFRLVVMGEIKKGKSSFINALLGEPDLLPTASDVATSTVFKLIYGPQKGFKVFFQPDVDTGRRHEPLEIEASTLKDFGTENGNPGNKKRVDFIGVELPHALLKEGLVIIDTPGVGGLFKNHRDITWRYAPNADAICFVLDSTEAVISRDELDFLRELIGKVTKLVFFVQTKTDIAGTEQWQAWEQRNKQLLTEHLGIQTKRLLYFPVSSKRKVIADKKSEEASAQQDELMRHLERSGFLKVLQFLSQGLMKQKEKRVAQNTARQLLVGCSELERELKDKYRIASVHSKEELDGFAKQFSESQKTLEMWERTTYRDEMQYFDDKFTDLKQKAVTNLQSELDPTGPIFDRIIGPLRSMEFDPTVVNQMAGQIQQECLAQASQVIVSVQDDFIAVCGHRAQAVLRESEAKLKEAQRLAKIGYWERDLVTDRIKWSEETARIFGQPTELASSAKLQEIIHPDDRRLQREALRDVLERGRKYDVEYRIVLPNGQIRFVRAWDELERDASGRVIRIFGTVQDITERKQAELLLHAQAQEIRAIVENSPDLIVRFDRQLRRTFVNTAFIKAMGLPKEMLLGREIASAAKDGAVKGTLEEIATLEGSLKRAFDTGRPLDVESTWLLTTGRRTLTVHLEPEFDARGALTSVLAISRDITERKRAEEAVKKAEDNLRFVLDATPALIHSARPDGYLDYFNQRWLDYVGLPLEALQGWGWRVAIYPEDVEGEVKRWRECVASGEPFEYEARVRRADGKYRWMLHRKEAMRDAHGNIIKWCGTAIDIEDRKQAEQLLKDSYDQLRALSARMQSVREEEATRIAREIHDDLGQKLTGLKMDLLRAERKLEGLESSPILNSLLDLIVSATELTDSITASVQEIAANLRPAMLDNLGLGAALHYESRRFQERTGILCEAHLPEIEPNLSTEVSTALFRIFQESLTNVARHAGATHVEAELKVEDGFLVLSLRDNGKGITEADLGNPRSLGLLGIKERVALLGGEVVYQGEPGQGTTVAVRVPMVGVAVATGAAV